MANKFTPKSNSSKFDSSSGSKPNFGNSNKTFGGSSKFNGSSGKKPSSDSKNTSNFTGGSGFRPSNKNLKPEEPEEKPKKERKPINKKKLGIVLLMSTLVLGGSYGYYYTQIDTGLPEQVEYSSSKDFLFEQMKSSWGTIDDSDSYSKDSYGSLVKTAYLNQELDYFNRDANKMKFFQYILSQVEFMPKKDKLTTRQGKNVEYYSEYPDNKFTFKIPDYAMIQERALNLDYKAIQEVYKQKKLSKEDYNYDSELTEVFIDYITSLGKLPVKEVEVELDVVKSKNGYTLKDDSNLDNILFASEDFHTLQDTFSAIANGDIGEMKDNPQYSAWQKRLEEYNKTRTEQITEKVKNERLEKKDSSDESNKETSDSKDSSKDSDTSSSDSSKEKEIKLDNRTEQILKEAEEKNKEDEQEMSKEVRQIERDSYNSELKLKQFYLGIETVQDTPKDGKFITKNTKSEEDSSNENIYSLYAKKLQSESELNKLKSDIENQTKSIAELKSKIDTLSKETGKEKEIEEAKKKLDEIEIQQEVNETKKSLSEREQEEQQSTKTLSLQEKAIGIEPKKQVFIRKQVDNPDWGTWNEVKDSVNLIEPPKTVNEPLKPQQNINYKWIGAYYLQNNYTNPQGESQKIKPQQGDGTKDYPSTKGTTVQTKAFDKSGNLHDVKIILDKVLLGEDAIKYAQSFDDRNEGFDTTADNKLVVIEYQILNLEKEDLTLTSGFQLVDGDGNPISRNGNMYSLKEEVNVKSKQVATMQDWFYTKDPEALYLVWGKGQEKAKYKWFDTLQFETKKVSKDTDQ